MPIAHQLIIFRELLDGIPLPHSLIIFNVINGFMIEDIEAAIDPAFLAMRFLTKVDNVIMIEHKPTESCRRQDGRYCGQLSVRFVELDGGLNVDI